MQFLLAISVPFSFAHWQISIPASPFHFLVLTHGNIINIFFVAFLPTFKMGLKLWTRFYFTRKCAQCTDIFFDFPLTFWLSPPFFGVNSETPRRMRACREPDAIGMTFLGPRASFCLTVIESMHAGRQAGRQEGRQADM